MPANPVSPFRSEATRRAEIRYPVPPAACDCHMHVFGPPDRYPGISGHSYAPREAPLSAWRSMAKCIGLQRVVVVQPSCYGTDNACLVAVLHELGGCARGVAVIAVATPPSALQALHDAGVRGVRLNAKSIGNRDAAGLRRLMLATAEQVAPLGWHVQVYADLAVLAQVTDSIRAAAAPIVLDHMGGASAADGAEALRPLLGLLSDGCCWVKLSGAYRVSQRASDFSDATPIARMLIQANPRRVVWGSDWPHTGLHAGRPQQGTVPMITFRDLDDSMLVDLLAEQAGDPATFRRILVDNPGRLYGF